MANAATFGSREHEVSMAVVDYGLAVWDEAFEALKATIKPRNGS